MQKIGIIGGAGYTGGELLRLLIHHPAVEIAFVHSHSQAGKHISEVHQDLFGETDLKFSSEVQADIDVLFACAGHGKTRPFLAENAFPESLKIIDLSRDFRLASAEHDFVYGLPELQRDTIRQTKHLANPGCFATCIQLALLPLAKAGELNTEVHVHALTGSTGAGQKPVGTTHYSWRNNNISIYKAFSHQHLGEIKQSLQQLQPSFQQSLNFLPMRGDFSRGIYASVYLNSDLSAEAATALYQTYYETHPFTHVSPENPHLKQVVNTNKAIVHVQKLDGKLLIVSMIDNLLKGASGQAVQNFNLMSGLDETTGLHLKAMAF